MPVIEIRDLVKRYDERVAVNEVSFTVDDGEIFGLLGPNGAGKTTTLSILSTLLAPDGGQVTVGGYDVSREASRVKPLIGYVPQELALFPTLSAQDNLAFLGRIYLLSGPALKERIAEVYTEIDPDTLLQSLPGLGEILAAAITAFIGEPERALSVKQAVALSGLHPRQKSSGGTDTPNQRLTRHGDPTLRSCLYVAAEIMRQYDPELRAYYRRLTTRGKHHKQAICALGAKILRRCVAC